MAARPPVTWWEAADANPGDTNWAWQSRKEVWSMTTPEPLPPLAAAGHGGRRWHAKGAHPGVPRLDRARHPRSAQRYPQRQAGGAAGASAALSGAHPWRPCPVGLARAGGALRSCCALTGGIFGDCATPRALPLAAHRPGAGGASGAHGPPPPPLVAGNRLAGEPLHP